MRVLAGVLPILLLAPMAAAQQSDAIVTVSVEPSFVRLYAGQIQTLNVTIVSQISCPAGNGPDQPVSVRAEPQFGFEGEQVAWSLAPGLWTAQWQPSGANTWSIQETLSAEIFVEEEVSVNQSASVGMTGAFDSSRLAECNVRGYQWRVDGGVRLTFVVGPRALENATFDEGLKDGGIRPTSQTPAGAVMALALVATVGVGAGIVLLSGLRPRVR